MALLESGRIASCRIKIKKKRLSETFSLFFVMYNRKPRKGKSARMDIIEGIEKQMSITSIVFL
jgi:hypothetical protein